ncbi:MAG TPA: response regulator transcription factor [Actinomycetota bacterium]|jgi:DNA-binding response OmpR family regulator
MPSQVAVPGSRRIASPTRILLIDDEPRILDFVSRGLQSEGFEVDVAVSGAQGLQMAISGRYDVIILDLLMPGLDGTSVLRDLVDRRPDQPVIILSALGDPDSKVGCLDLGADDYLTKPFVLDELIARIRARLRALARRIPKLVAGRLTLDVIRREADPGSGPVALAEREFLLLQELMRNAGRTVSKERLLNSVWGYHFDPGTNVLDVYVRRLRAKLGSDLIQTVRGEGYRLDAS